MKSYLEDLLAFESVDPWDCTRCDGYPTASKGILGDTCPNCGVNRSRVAQRKRRRAKIGGKRGRNSGKVSQHGKKK